MKNLFIATTLFLASTSAFADCVNLSGTFTLSGSPTTVLKTTQNECTSVEFDYQENGPNGSILSKVYPLDGIRRITYQDATWIVHETSEFQGPVLANLVEDYAVATEETITAVTNFYLDANNNLVNTNKSYDDTGALTNTTSYLYIRN